VEKTLSAKEAAMCRINQRMVEHQLTEPTRHKSYNFDMRGKSCWTGFCQTLVVRLVGVVSADPPWNWTGLVREYEELHDNEIMDIPVGDLLTNWFIFL
jgi:hypothetical protein